MTTGLSSGVTGAAGCIGAWVVARLAGASRPVVALDRADDRRRLLLAMDESTVLAIPLGRSR